MAGAMLEQLAADEGVALKVTTAGTHVVEGQPMSSRVRQAMIALGELDVSQLGRHRSRQLSSEDAARADLIVAMEADHVAFVRRNHPEAGATTATIRRLVTELPLDGGGARERISSLGLAGVDLASEVDVLDPAGGEQLIYDSCAEELWGLCQALVVVLG
jgi:protein-tyrosine-phosphatase